MKKWVVVVYALAAGAANAQTTTTEPSPPQPVTSPAPPASAPSSAPVAEKKKEEKKGPTVKVSGFIQGRYTLNVDQDDSAAVTLPSGSGATPTPAQLQAATSPSTFSIPRARLRASGEVVDRVGYVVEGDFAVSTNILTDAYARITFAPNHEIRLGQQKTQFGYENPESDTALLTVNRTLVSGALAQGNASRDLGVGIIGKIPVAGGIGLDWAGTLVNGAGTGRTTDDALAPQKDFWGRVGPSLKLGRATVRAGVSMARGYDVGTTATSAYRFLFRRVGVDVQFDTPWMFAAAEHVQGDDLQQPATLERSGQYIYAYGKTPWQLGPIVRYETFDPNDNVGGDQRERYTLGAYYDRLPRNARVFVNYELDQSGTRRDDFFYVQTQVVF